MRAGECTVGEWMWGTSSTQGVSNCKLRKYTSAFQAPMVCCPDGALEINTIPLFFNLDKTSPLLLEAWHPEPMLTTWHCGITQCNWRGEVFLQVWRRDNFGPGTFCKGFCGLFCFLSLYNFFFLSDKVQRFSPLFGVLCHKLLVIS